jgi:hypothetical protein
VRLVIAEWIPFGVNSVICLHDRLGALETCKDGLFRQKSRIRIV